MTGKARVTSVGAYVEQDPASATRVTSVGAYVEFRPPGRVRTTSLGVYVEIWKPVGHVYLHRVRES